jgi:hypothetical protein
MPGQRRPEDRFQSRGRAPVARQPHKLEEVGSIPTPGTISCSPVAQIEERPILTREVDGANPSGAATFMEVKADKRAAAGWKPDGAAIRSLWSMTTDFRFGSQALQRCSGLLNRGARGSTVATHQFQNGS